MRWCAHHCIRQSNFRVSVMSLAAALYPTGCSFSFVDLAHLCNSKQIVGVVDTTGDESMHELWQLSHIQWFVLVGVAHWQKHVVLIAVAWMPFRLSSDRCGVRHDNHTNCAKWVHDVSPQLLLQLAYCRFLSLIYRRIGLPSWQKCQQSCSGTLGKYPSIDFDRRAEKRGTFWRFMLLEHSFELSRRQCCSLVNRLSRPSVRVTVVTGKR